MGFLSRLKTFVSSLLLPIFDYGVKYGPFIETVKTAMPSNNTPKGYPSWVSGNDVDVIAKTIWGEARSEGERGMQAVANVIRNRWLKANRGSKRVTWWGTTWRGICQKQQNGTYQFTCWSPRDPNRAKMDAQRLNNGDALFSKAVLIAQRCIAGDLPDLTNGADHYYATWIKKPYWAEGETVIAAVGSHRFYDLA